MKNMKVAAKLIVSFGLIIAFLIISMAVSIFNIQKLSEKVEYYSQQAIPIINAMWTGRRAMVATERALYHAAATADVTATKTFVEDAETQISSLKDILVTLQASYSGDMKDVEKYKSLMDSTKETKEQVYELLLNNQNAEGLKLMSESYTPTFVEAGNLLAEMAEGVQGRVDAYSEEAAQNIVTAMVMLVTLAAISLLVAVVICVAIVKSITKPVKEIEQAAIQMSEGNLDVNLTYQSRDELGNLADKIRMLTDNLKTIITDESQLLGDMSAGNFDVKTSCEDRYVGGFNAILVSIRGINRSLSDTLAQINEAADQVSSGSDQVASGAQALSQGATEQASSVEELAATINAISGQVKVNAENAQKASTLADTAGQEMLESSGQMQEMKKAMGEISSSSSEISKIIKTIEDIAFQTNILALNAAVEAARAGAAGKGFAVVADEVRNLANKSQEASKNTAVLIEGSLRAVENGTAIAQRAADSMMGTMERARAVTETVNGISAASEQQAHSIAQVTQGVDQISSVVQTNSATAEESAAASEELSGQAQMLKSLVSRFRLRNGGSYGAQAEQEEAMPYDRPREYAAAPTGGLSDKY